MTMDAHTYVKDTLRTMAAGGSITTTRNDELVDLGLSEPVKPITVAIACARHLNGLGPDRTGGPIAAEVHALVKEIA